MTEKTLSSGRKVIIRRLSRPEIRDIKDLGSQRIYPDGSMGLVGANKILSGADYPLLKQKTIFEPLNNNDVGSREKLSMLGEVAASVFKINIK